MRRRGRWLPLLLLAAMVAELVVFMLLGSWIGFGLTLLLVVLASGLGLVLLRAEGLRAWRGFQHAAAAGSPPGPRVTDGVVGLGGALLLAAPGLLTGAVGAALLLPPVRALARGQVQARAERRMSAAAAGEVFGPRRVWVGQDDHPSDTEPEVVEGEIIDGEQPHPR